ncbi:hypothetical protein PIROE2DRAFT_56759 [Piromyces sp. E2]|nr:hypothetical protein PIROE2DRAFT_56759 [Piromyces sp. E2]|eukprot:OUM70448.1 hypothetical protein PIROE2DRAFT_56759 [Piromyces sp. E2]
MAFIMNTNEHKGISYFKNVEQRNTGNINGMTDGVYLKMDKLKVNNIISQGGSEYGTILNIKDIGDKSQGYVDVINSYFENINASIYGGVVFSLGEYTNKHVRFEECVFKNTTVSIGGISFSLDKKSEPYFSNIDEIRKTEGAFATNPTKVILNSNSKDKFILFSGEKIPEGITCNYYL